MVIRGAAVSMIRVMTAGAPGCLGIGQAELERDFGSRRCYNFCLGHMELDPSFQLLQPPPHPTSSTPFPALVPAHQFLQRQIARFQAPHQLLQFLQRSLVGRRHGGFGTLGGFLGHGAEDVGKIAF